MTFVHRVTRATAAALVLAGAAGAPSAAQQGHEHHHPAAGAAPAPIPEPERADGLTVPNSAVVDQNGRPVRFYDDLVKGRVVAINFVFTTCTTICPPMGATFGKVQELLGNRAGRDVHLISVSVDPATDTPERMKEWGRKFGAGPGWTLVTGERSEVTRLLKALGAYAPNINDHSPLVLVGNAKAGQWTRAYGLASPVKLVEVIDQVAGGPTPQKHQEGTR